MASDRIASPMGADVGAGLGLDNSIASTVPPAANGAAGLAGVAGTAASADLSPNGVYSAVTPQLGASELGRLGSEHTLPFLSALFAPGDHFEIRVITKGNGARSSQFTEVWRATAWAICNDQEHAPGGTYVTINPGLPDATSAATSDQDVLCRRWLPIDVDPVRPKESSATDAERDAARQVRELAIDRLKGLGFSEPIRVDSGNGFHAYFRVDLPADDGKRVNRLLRLLAREVNSGSAKLDTTVSNAARIMRLPGTMNRKGEPTSERPHRYCLLESVPDHLVAMTNAQFDQILSVLEAESAAAQGPGGTTAGKKSAVRPPGKARATLALPQLGRIEKECSFMRHCRDDAASLSEPHWHAWAGIVGPCRGGEALFHEISQAHPGYSQPEAAEKLARAMAQAGPRTCQNIAEDLGHEGCITCKHMGKITSPIQLGSAAGNGTEVHEFARRFVEQHYTHDGRETLIHWEGTFYAWQDGAYPVLPEEVLKSKVHAQAVTEAEQLEGKPDVPPKPKDVHNAVETLRRIVQVETPAEDHTWLRNQEGRPPAADLIVARNGLVSVITGELLPHTPEFFARATASFEFDPLAAAPEWEGFLGELLDGDDEAMRALQEFSGYLLTADTSHQKFLMLIGPPRSGKGTICRVLEALVGEKATFRGVLDGLSAQFGVQSLIGTRLATFGDVRFNDRANTKLLSLLLSITGGDRPALARKYLPDYTGPLQVRFVVCANEVPTVNDPSNALAARALSIRLTRSFEGKEDTGLSERLLQELPGIFNWALEGLRRLRSRGRFQQPQSGKEVLETLRNQSSPLGEFVEHLCVLDADRDVEVANVYAAYQAWCTDRGEQPMPRQRFLGDLTAAFPAISRRQLARGTARPRCLVGIGLRLEGDPRPLEDQTPALRLATDPDERGAAPPGVGGLMPNDAA